MAGREMAKDRIALVIRTTAKPGQRQRLVEAWERHLQPRAEANAAQQVYFLCLDNEDPDSFYLFEIYSDPAVLAENANAAWFADYMAEVMPLIAHTEMAQATPVWEKLPNAKTVV